MSRMRVLRRRIVLVPAVAISTSRFQPGKMLQRQSRSSSKSHRICAIGPVGRESTGLKKLYNNSSSDIGVNLKVGCISTSVTLRNPRTPRQIDPVTGAQLRGRFTPSRRSRSSDRVHSLSSSLVVWSVTLGGCASSFVLTCGRLSMGMLVAGGSVLRVEPDSVV